MKTIAIVGSHSRTRSDAPWERKDTVIWVFNEAASIGWPKRVDGVFQMHAAAVWKNPLNRNDTDFPNWMQAEHPFPVFMQTVDEMVPASKAYPLEEVCRKLLGKLWKGQPPKGIPSLNRKRKGSHRARFFTSTVAYALALAIFQEAERIELYGVEMESDTEYTYQREGVFFWLGVAVGRGIEVVVHEQSGFFDEPLYGYEGDVTLREIHLRQRLDTLSPLRMQTLAKLKAANAAQKAVLDDAMEQSGGEPGLADVATTKRYFATIKEQAGAMLDLGMLEGAISEDERYLKKIAEMQKASGDHFLARQEFEITMANASELQKKREAHMHVVGGEATAAWKAMDQAIKAEAGETEIRKLAEAYGAQHENYLKATYEAGRIGGIVNENMTLVGMTDEMLKAAGGSKAEEAFAVQRDDLARKNGNERSSERVVAAIDGG